MTNIEKATKLREAAHLIEVDNRVNRYRINRLITEVTNALAKEETNEAVKRREAVEPNREATAD